MPCTHAACARASCSGWPPRRATRTMPSKVPDQTCSSLATNRQLPPREPPNVCQSARCQQPWIGVLPAYLRVLPPPPARVLETRPVRGSRAVRRPVPFRWPWPRTGASARYTSRSSAHMQRTGSASMRSTQCACESLPGICCTGHFPGATGACGAGDAGRGDEMAFVGARHAVPDRGEATRGGAAAARDRGELTGRTDIRQSVALFGAKTGEASAEYPLPPVAVSGVCRLPYKR
jgi:hypothetical protein